MADPFYGEIRFFAFSYPPIDWAQCNGQLAPIQQYQALYALLGVNFGGDGKATFGLPNLQGQAAAGFANNNVNYQRVGQTGGTETVLLSGSQCPMHTHTVNVNLPGAPADLSTTPVTGCKLSLTVNQYDFAASQVSPFDVTSPGLAPSAIGPALGATNGTVTPHENRQPFLVLQPCICVSGGIWPEKPD